MSASPATSRQIAAVRRSLAAALTRFNSERNPDCEDYQRLIKRTGELEDGVVALLTQLSAWHPDYTLARSILGGDFITAEEIMAAGPGNGYSPEQIAQLEATIPSEEVLRLLKENGYGLMPQPSCKLCLLGVWSATATRTVGRWYSSQPVFAYPNWASKQEFAEKDLTGTGWLAIKKAPDNGSLGRSWNEQNTLLSSAEYVPNAAETSWFITVFYGVRGVWLFEKVYVRTSSIDSNGLHVVVGHGTEGLSICDGWDGGCSSDRGLAPAWKL